MVRIKGLHRVRSKGAVYWYAWRGGPRIDAEPGTPEFLAAYNEAIAERSAPDPAKFRAVITAYKASPDFARLAPSTRKMWALWLDRICDHFGDLRTAQFDRPARIRPLIIKWRSTYQATPRAADYGLQVLSRVCSHAVDPLGQLASNPCEGIRRLYTANRADVIWTDADIATLKKTAPTEIGHAVDLAAMTGLRVSDLIRLAWSHVGEHEIVISTGKSRHRREAVIPIYDDLRAFLAGLPRRATTVLTSSLGRPWTRDGLGSSFNKAKKQAEMADSQLHFHDLRGTAATKFYQAGLPMRVIAEIMGWEEAYVERIIHRYVGRNAATLAVIRQLRKTETGTETVKLAVKPSSKDG